MSEETEVPPEKRLENLARLLDRATKEPSMLLARDFLGDARQFLSQGDASAAQRSIAAASMALRFSGVRVPSLASEAAPAPRRVRPPELEPPAPPTPLESG